MSIVAYPSYVEKEAACYHLHQPSLWEYLKEHSHIGRKDFLGS
jgi:hypothetical protein